MAHKTTILISLLAIDLAKAADLFNFGDTSGRDYGPADWDEVSCNNLDTCPGWPDKLEGSVGWTLTENNCRSCPIEGNSCGQHRQSPIDLHRDRAIEGHENEKECPDWHWMQYKDGSCQFDDILDQFEIARHALQIHTPLRANGDIDCENEAGERKFPKVDYSKGFPDWWYLSRTDISVPSHHVQHGQRYAAEVVLSHFYEIDHYKNKLGKISIFMQDFEGEPAWHYLDKLICQWRRLEEQKRSACGLDPAPVYKMCELYRGQVRTDDDFEVPTESANNYPTRAPLVPPRAIPIENFGGDPEEFLLPLQLCQGDCDFSTDCAEGLICHRRDPYEEVPGCIGGEQDETNTDYCVFDPFGEGYHVPTDSPTSEPTITARPSLTPLPPKALRDFGGDPPTDELPLQLCEGDCDGDHHCAEGLVCFQRDENEAVPGCIGGTSDIQKTDYCILDVYGPGYELPPTDAPSPLPTQIPSKQPTSMPTRAPQTPAPVITPAPQTNPPVVDPTTQPTSKPTKVPSSSPSINPTMMPTPLQTPRPTAPLVSVSNKGWEPPVPLGECEGDCDEDSDCGPGMYCYQRNAISSPVPGCAGGENDLTLADFCTYGSNRPILPPTSEPAAEVPTTAPPVGSPVPSPTELASSSPTAAKWVHNSGWSPAEPLPECYGDCDEDSDCMGDLRCFQRDAPNAPVPGCMGGEADGMLTDYCVLPSYVPDSPTDPPASAVQTDEPTGSPTRPPSVQSPSSAPEPIPYNNLGWSPPTSSLPLGRCEGDCDIDSDCGPGLVCYQRYLPNTAIPGCIGGGSDPTLTDYCIIDTAATPSPVTPFSATLPPSVNTPAPASSAPVTSAPVTSSPVTASPVTSAPATDAPVAAAPVSPAPASPAPVSPAPVSPAPISPAPVSPAPTTPAPVTPAPVTPAPATPAPVTSAPVTSPTPPPTPPAITCGDYPDANFFRMCKDNSCCQNPRSTSEFCEETYALLGGAVESACHFCCIEERGFSLQVGPGPGSSPVSPSPVAAPMTPAPVQTSSGVPPEITCDAYDVNYYRMCKDDSCCQSPRSNSQFCHETYFTLGDAAESACHHCCLEERGVALSVGPAPVQNAAIAKTVSCDDELLNAARMCKEDSCCDGEDLDSGFCAETLSLYSSISNALESICWYCCHPSKVAPDRRALGGIVAPDIQVSVSSLAPGLSTTDAAKSSSSSILMDRVASKFSKEIPTRVFNDTREIGENDVVTHDVTGRKIIVREENFEEKGLDNEEEYFDDLYSDYHRRMQTDNLATENYDNVFWWPYEWLLKVGTEYYFRYEGTQTVPPCYETAHWRVLKDPIRVAPHQMRELERLMAWRLGDECTVDTAGKPREGNPDAVDVNRPLQSYHKLHRKVFCECKDWPSKFPQDREWCRNWKNRDPELRLFDRPYNFRSDGFDFLND